MGTLQFSKTFRLTDESLDSHSQRVIAKGIDLKRFKKNPVMFYNHIRANGGLFSSPDTKFLPIGIWKNIRLNEGEILADAYHDTSDELGLKVYSKVVAGVLNSASVGIKPRALSDDPADKIVGQKGLTVTKSELLEASITDIPANPNAVAIDKSILSKSDQDINLELDKETLYLTANVVEEEVEITNNKVDKMDKTSWLNSFKSLFTKSEDENIEELTAEKALENLANKVAPGIEGKIDSAISKAFDTHVESFKSDITEKFTNVQDELSKKASSEDFEALKTKNEELEAEIESLKKSFGDLKTEQANTDQIVAKQLGAKEVSLSGNKTAEVHLENGSGEITSVDEEVFKQAFG